MIKISLIIPCYNEYNRLPETIKKILIFLLLFKFLIIGDNNPYSALLPENTQSLIKVLNLSF